MSTETHSAGEAEAKAVNPAVEAFRRQREMSRLLAVQMAYAMDANDRWECTDEAFNDFVELAVSENAEAMESRYIDKATQRARHIVNALCQCHGEMDELIIAATKNWTISRIHRVERSIMRVAIYEMKYDDNVSPAVAINEAIELSKRLGQGDSGRFINGVLDKVRRNLGLTSSVKGGTEN